MMDESAAGQPAASFAVLLRRLRVQARLTQEELAEKAGLSPRSISDLERGVSRTARKETARLLADALGVTGPVRAAFVAAARGKGPARDVSAALERLPTWPAQTSMACGPCADLGFALQDAKIGQLTDALTAASRNGGPVARIWVIGLTTPIAREATPPGPGVLNANQASTGSVARLTQKERHRPPSAAASRPMQRSRSVTQPGRCSPGAARVNGHPPQSEPRLQLTPRRIQEVGGAAEHGALFAGKGSLPGTQRILLVHAVGVTLLLMGGKASCSRLGPAVMVRP